MYTDRKVPRNSRPAPRACSRWSRSAWARSCGTYLSGQFLEHYKLAEHAGGIAHDWPMFWLWAAVMSALTAIVFFLLFSAKSDALPDAAAGERN